MQDIHSSVSLATLIGAAVISADNTPVSIDLRGFDAAEVLLAIGAGGITFSGTNRIDFVLTHSDDDSVYVPVTTVDMLGVTVASGGIIKSLISAHAAAASYRFGYVGNRRFLRLLADFSGTHGAGTPIAAMAMRGAANVKPTADQP